MAKVEVVTREYLFKKIKLQDPDPAFSDDQVRNYYIGTYPDMLNTKVSITKKNGKEIREFRPKVGSHG